MTILKMIKNISTIIILGMVLSLQAQVENVHMTNDVYEFLKEMKVKGIIENISDDNPNLSFGRVKDLLVRIEEKYQQLSLTELARLKKYRDEFFYDELPLDRKWEMFGSDSVSGSFSNFFSDRQKLMYSSIKDGNTFKMEMLGKVYHGQELSPNKANTTLFGGGVRFYGTLFDKLGYHFSFHKGLARGSRGFGETMAPWLNSNYHWVENLEKIGNYDFVEGYLKYAVEPTEGMNLSVQLGREPISFGYGYGDKFVLSYIDNNFDFLKVNFDYGMIEYTSLHASTVGSFSFDRSENYSKYFALNRVKFKFDNLFDFGFGETIIYSGRSFDLGYVNPLIFYKFVEMSLQDRDNGTFHFDFQTKCLNNIEFQGTFFMDESVIWRLSELDQYVNKTAYQVGGYWYEAFGIDDLSFILEYTRIRPYVYTHSNQKNNYTSYDRLLGHQIGPNSDEIYAKLAYNFSADFRATVEYKKIRSGRNVLDEDGNVLRNVGSDPNVPWRFESDSKQSLFLDGVLFNNHIIKADFRWEPVRDLAFNLIYYLNSEKNITLDKVYSTSYLMLVMTFDI
ncbi:MAG: capsule assembly Wzi family protein [Bacteroidetes bacterium]|nr:capsule assembly Wzi family protein [Bacteroidota bacterium]